jgi:hypothetical protein
VARSARRQRASVRWAMLAREGEDVRMAEGRVLNCVMQ